MFHLLKCFWNHFCSYGLGLSCLGLAARLLPQTSGCSSFPAFTVALFLPNVSKATEQLFQKPISTCHSPEQFPLVVSHPLGGNPKSHTLLQSQTLAKSLLILLSHFLPSSPSSFHAKHIALLLLIEPSQYSYALALPRTDVDTLNTLSSFQSWLKCFF